MSLIITKNCFPPADKCANCLRKGSIEVRKKPITEKDYKRCGNCHLFTYCDKDCQRDHWNQVHKHHCRFLSGKVQVKNNLHNSPTCVQCIEERESSLTQLKSGNSPRTACNILGVAIAMKKRLGLGFGFHEEGKKGHCTMEFPCELPFSLGEVSGQYIEKGSTGLDAMLAHALKILNAMFIKAQEDHCFALNRLWNDVILARTQLWYDILVCGMQRFRPPKHLSGQVDSLELIYGPSNPWWKSLKFSVDFIVKTYFNLISNVEDSQSLGNPRFQNLKLVYDYRQSQLQNQAKVSEKKAWPNFLLWPTFSNGSLSLLLPPSTHCQSCHSELGGELAVTPQDVNAKSLPCLFPDVGDDGGLMASCSITKNPNCRKDCFFKNVENRIRSNENQWKQSQQENSVFANESRDCDLCLKASLSSHRCSACLSVQYCSTVCQKKDIEFHKTVCATWAKDKSRSIKGKDGQLDHWKLFFAEQKETFH